ncbi:MAG: hypothetical protein Q7S87_01545 [Agitococcus sp.]|nr:hypothetical protein [Agitococcus sp.]
MTERVLELKDVALSSDAKHVFYSHNGYIIDGEARVHALTERWFHGVCLAVLYPDIAQKAGYSPPTMEDGEVDVFKYQEFEHAVSYELPVLRISSSQLTGATMVSAGGHAPSDAQLEALAAVFKVMGLRANDTLTGEDTDITVTQFVESLRQLRKESPESEENYTLVEPDESESNPC